MNKSVMKCCICNNENIGEFITINNKKYHLYCIEQLQQENQELKKQLEEINKFKFSYRKDETKIPPIIRKQKDVEIIKKLENQQKEFIEYLENMLDNKNDIFSVVRVKDVLSKFKKIIGSDINVGSIGDKE